MAVAVGYEDGSLSGASGSPCFLLSASGDSTARLWIDSGRPPGGAGEHAPPPFKLKAVLEGGHTKALFAAELVVAHGLAATGGEDGEIRCARLPAGVLARALFSAPCPPPALPPAGRQPVVPCAPRLPPGTLGPQVPHQRHTMA